MRALVLAALAAALLIPASAAFAQTPQDRVTFGGDAIVRQGEVVNDLVTMGGDAVVEGQVLGDVVTMGGDLAVGSTAEIGGDLVTMGGRLEVAPGASTGGDIVGFGGVGSGPAFPHHVPDPGGIGGFIVDAVSSLVSYALLFVLGLMLMGLARERLDALQLVILKRPARAAATGILGFVGAIVGIVVLAITIIGIPAAIILAIALPLAVYVGMAAAASVLGAALPIASLKGRPVLQLAAGVGTLFVASLVPFLGTLLVAATAVVGLGALVVTRFEKASRVDLGPDPVPSGPYRTQSV